MRKNDNRHGKGKEVDILLTTLEDRRLTEGDNVVVSLGSGEYEVEILDSSDPAKLKVKLDTGSTIWIGRRAILDVVNGD